MVLGLGALLGHQRLSFYVLYVIPVHSGCRQQAIALIGEVAANNVGDALPPSDPWNRSRPKENTAPSDPSVDPSWFNEIKQPTTALVGVPVWPRWRCRRACSRSARSRWSRVLSGTRLRPRRRVRNGSGARQDAPGAGRPAPLAPRPSDAGCAPRRRPSCGRASSRRARC